MGYEATPADIEDLHLLKMEWSTKQGPQSKYPKVMKQLEKFEKKMIDPDNSKILKRIESIKKVIKPFLI